MKKILFATLIGGTALTANAQFQVNPQVGLTWQTLTNPSPGVDYQGAAGWQLGADLRFGDRFYFQPGAFLSRNTTVAAYGDSISFEDKLVRTNLKLRAMLGYRIIDSYQFDMRFSLGTSYDVLLSVDAKGDTPSYNEGDFNKGSWNLDMGLGFDMGMFSLEPGVSFGMSRVFDEDVIVLKDIDSSYLTYGLTIGINIGNDD